MLSEETSVKSFNWSLASWAPAAAVVHTPDPLQEFSQRCPALVPQCSTLLLRDEGVPL